MKLLFIILIFLTNTVFSQKAKLLEKAYIHNSQIILDEFFSSWQNEIKTITSSELQQQNDTIKSIYNIYNLIFKSEFNKSPHVSKEFLVFSNKINYSFVDFFYDKYWLRDSLAYKIIIEADSNLHSKLDTISEVWAEAFSGSNMYKDSISFFRPIIDGKNSILYVSKDYEKILYYYMFRVNYKHGTLHLMKETNLNGEEISDRIAFLESKIPVPYVKHSDRGTVYSVGSTIMTEPEIKSITFGNNYNTAQVDYYMNCNIFRAYLLKINNEWKLLKTKFFMCVCG